MMQASIIVREASVTDANALSALSIHVWLNTYAREGVSDVIAHYVMEELSPDNFVSKLKQSTDQILVAEYDNNIVGFIELLENSSCPKKPGETLEIDKLYVMPKFHGNGIGSMLLQAFKKIYYKKGYTSFWLTTWDQNVEAIKFYEHKGFIKVGETSIKIGNIDSPNIIFIGPVSVGSP